MGAGFVYMEHYDVEACATTLKGTVTCGSSCGYGGGKEFTLEETLDILDGVNKEIVDDGFSPIPCILREGVLAGRASSESYREKVFSMNFSWSPRVAPMDKTIFYETLLKYANVLGQKMGQERMYLEFDNQTEVLKKK